jgi:hypothetical protein
MSEADLLHRFLLARSIEEHHASDADVASLWEKAVQSSRDARTPTIALDNRYVLGYQALLQMGTAILAAAGYRTRGAQGHHANTFMAVSALGIDGLKSIDLRVNAIRRKRAQSAYEPSSPSLHPLESLLELVDSTPPLARAWLAVRRPNARMARLNER